MPCHIVHIPQLNKHPFDFLRCRISLSTIVFLSFSRTNSPGRTSISCFAMSFNAKFPFTSFIARSVRDLTLYLNNLLHHHHPERRSTDARPFLPVETHVAASVQLPTFWFLFPCFRISLPISLAWEGRHHQNHLRRQEARCRRYAQRENYGGPKIGG